MPVPVFTGADIMFRNFLARAGYPVDPPFEGFSDELCFIPGWRKTNNAGYHFVGAKEFAEPRTEVGHRLVVKLLLGPLDGWVLHRCGNASCLNPYHLYVGDADQNSSDRKLHEAARAAKNVENSTEDVGQWVRKPKPVALSQEESLMTRRFPGFFPDRCFFADWLHFTFDGYPQLCESEHPGAVVGAHRKIYQLFNWPLNKYDILIHACNNKHCLNPYHIVKFGRENVDDWDFKYDRRCKINQAGREMIKDRTMSAKEVSQEIGLHIQRVYELRRALG